MSTSSALENLETQLETFIENVRQVRIIVSDFQPQGHNVLNQKMYVWTCSRRNRFCKHLLIILFFFLLNVKHLLSRVRFFLDKA